MNRPSSWKSSCPSKKEAEFQETLFLQRPMGKMASDSQTIPSPDGEPAEDHPRIPILRDHFPTANWRPFFLFSQ
jgi:hypothetical protein